MRQLEHHAAFEKMFPTNERLEECCNKVRSTVFRHIGNPDEAEEIVQHAIVQALTHAGRFQQRSSPETWITRIAINLVFARRRKKKVETLGDFDDDIVAPGAEPLDALIHQEELAAARDFADKADRVNPDLFEYFSADVKAKELAERKGMKPEAVKTQLRRSRIFLQENFPEYRPF